jgi:hypothetical protein
MAGVLDDVTALDPSMVVTARLIVTLAAAIITSQGISADFAAKEAFKIYDAVLAVELQREKSTGE